MTRLLVALLGICGGCLAGCSRSHAASLPPDQPSVLFVLLDDTGSGDFAFRERETSPPSPRGLHTPTFDLLAREGLRLGSYYVQEMCTPTRAALLTGRYPFRYGMTTYTICAVCPWGIPLEEHFLGEAMQHLGYDTFMTGKWHLGMFKPEYLPQHRGFDVATNVLSNAKADHFHHTLDDGYDWHSFDSATAAWTSLPEAFDVYAGNLVRDSTVRYLQQVKEKRQGGTERRAFFAYVAFTEAHSPFQAPDAYLGMYEHLSDNPDRQAVAAMISHNDAMVGDIIAALQVEGLRDETLVIVSSDNGAPGGAATDQPDSANQRWDDWVVDRNFPLRGLKHEIWEGGTRSVAFLNSPLLPTSTQGRRHEELFHVTDWFPTLVGLAVHGMAASLDRLQLLDLSSTTLPEAAVALDGVDQWPCLMQHAQACKRQDVLYNLNVMCDRRPWVLKDPTSYESEVPAPKAGLRLGDMKLVVECYDVASGTIKGRRMLFNLTADPTESRDLAGRAEFHEVVEAMETRIQDFGREAAPPYLSEEPWQGWNALDYKSYFCARCPQGNTTALPLSHGGVYPSWEPWCDTATNEPC